MSTSRLHMPRNLIIR